MSTHQQLVKVIEWATAAAKEQVQIAQSRCEAPDLDYGMGLWQSFQAEFPKEPGVDYDILVTALSATYRAVVKAIPVLVCPDCESLHNTTFFVEECQKHCRDLVVKEPQ